MFPRSATGRSSLVPPPPWHYSGQLLTVEYRTDPAAVAELLPAPLSPAAEDPGAVAVIWAGLVSLVVLAQTVTSITELLWLVGGVHAVVLSALVVLSVAVIGKFAGAFLGARLSRMSAREGFALGAGMNARGVVEIVVAMAGCGSG